MDINLTKQQIQEAAQQAYDYASKLTGGANANYIPYLANIDSNLFGLSVMLPDGTAYNFGDTEYKFGIESVSKVPTAILAMRQHTPARSSQGHRRGRHRPAVQLNLRHPPRERPPLDPACQRRCHIGMLDD